jgi:aquaporin Z
MVKLSPSMVRILKGLSPYIVEFIGSFFLSLVVNCALMNPNWKLNDDDPSGGAVPSYPNPYAPMAIGSALLITVYMGGHISGGHYNPAVSLAVYLSGREQLAVNSLLFYWVNQFLGGSLAGMIAYGLFNNSPGVFMYYKHGTGRIFGAEWLGTLLLCLVVLHVGTTKKISGNNFFGLAIGFTLIAASVSVGQISGGAFNPAVASSVFICCNLDSKAITKGAYAYYLAQFFAALIAPLIYFLTNIGEEYYEKEALAGEAEAAPEDKDIIPNRRSTASQLSLVSAASKANEETMPTA